MGQSAAEMKAAGLRCEYLVNPAGIDAEQPRLSWLVNAEQRGAKQTAYQILVASSADGLGRDKGDVWDSGKTASEQSIQIPYGGPALSSGQRCHWKVRLWNEFDQGGPWSEAGSWSMGLLKPEEWKGQYVGLAPGEGTPSCPWLRKTFELGEVAANATAYVNALGYYELYINGERADDTMLTPPNSQFSRRSFYRTHDVTPLLRKGVNCVALWLGPGWYRESLPGVVYKGPLVRAQLELRDAQGGAQHIVTGPDWKVSPSFIVYEGNWDKHSFGGERFDARAEQPAWNQPDFDDKAWANANVVDVPAHTVSALPVEPNRIQRRYEPADVKLFGNKTWLVDFGTNLSGWFEIAFRGLNPGQEIVLEYADYLSAGDFDSFGQRDVYVARGEDGERFCSRFNYRAFRYVRISGLDEAPARGDMAAYLIRADYELNSSFVCSDPMLNRVHDMIFYTIQCLTIGSNLVDCPHIERLGYGGDGQASTPTALTMFGMGPMYTAWLGHWRDCQRPDGGMPHTAPNPFPAGGGPYWCGFIIAASWEMFQQYGDRRVLEVNYPAMQLWLDGYVESYCKDGLLQQWPDNDYRGWYLGDWARPGRTDAEAKRSVHLVNNCFRIQCFDWMARIAAELGRPDDAKRYQEKAGALRPIVHRAFYDPDRKTYADDTQLDLAYPLLVGVTPEPLRPEIAKRLEDDILVKHEGHLDVGLVGVPLLTAELMAADRNDLVYAITSTDSFPGWGYMLRNGATTTWEHWDADRSHIHNCYNGIGVWFYRALAGIQPDAAAPGFKHFTLRPAPVGGITWVTARQETVHGAIESAWRIKDGTFEWSVRVPANTSATVMIPTLLPEHVTESGSPAELAQGLHYEGLKGNRAVFEAQAGRYAFSAPTKEK